MIKILNKINSMEIFREFHKLEKDIVWTEYGHKGKQSGLQYADHEDIWTSAVGRRQNSETLYSNLNDFFKNTVFEKIINEYQLKRTRLMWTYPYACYSMHRDESPRIHIPIVTNSQCFFVFKKGLIEHLSLGNVYWVDTRKFHTFINCSEFPRLHLVGVVSE